MQEAPSAQKKTVAKVGSGLWVVVSAVTVWALDVSLSVILWLGARTRRAQPTRRSSLTSRPDIRARFLREQKKKCVYCRDVISDQKGNCEIDHKIPLSRQGPDKPENLQALCRRCNKGKGARTHLEYIHYLKYNVDLDSYIQFKSRSPYATPREILRVAQFILIPALSGTGLIIGNETIERPFTGAGLFCILAIAWVVGLWKRGTKTGALGN